tara:strand:+ start:195 stop:2357 length:2163 start_codon:yes stop_codon:yes gene_type:complete
MAIDNRIQTEFTSDRNTFYRVTIIDTLSSTSTLYTDVENSEEGFVLTYETEDDNRFTGLIPSKCDFSFFITDSSGGGNQTNINSIVDSIRTSDYKRWKLKIESGANDSSYSLFWVGNLLNDINAEDDISLPRKVTLTAICGLGALDNIPFNEEVNYNFAASYSPYRYIYNSLTTDIDTDNNWGTDDIYIKTIVDWTNATMTRAVGNDPLNLSRFKASAYAPIDDNGVRQPETAFRLLDDICKGFGARLFLSNGVWTFVQVNTYEQMNSSTQFFRTYKKGNNGGTYTPDTTGSETLNKTEDGTNIQRLAGNDFDQLSILKEVKLIYEMFKAYDLDPLRILDESGGVLSAEAPNNAIVAWKGYHTNSEGFQTESDIYGINDATTDFISYELGEVQQVTGQTIKVKRNFNRAFNGSYSDFSSITSGHNTSVLFYHRLKLVGTSSTQYCRSSYTNGGLATWTTNDVFGNAPGYNVPFTFIGSSFFFNATPQNASLLEFESAEVPFAGTLFFQCYARVFFNYTNADPLTGTEVTTPADQAKFYIFSPPENSENQLIQAYVNGESTSQQVFTTSQNISNGVTQDLGEVFFGTGPNASAQGRLEASANGTTFDNGTVASWKAYGTGTGKSISALLLNEVMKGQNDGAKIFNGSLKILSQNDGTNGYKFNNGITIDSKFYIPYQCSFIANQDTWKGEWYEINTSSPTLTDTIEAQSLVNNTNINTNTW